MVDSIKKNHYNFIIIFVGKFNWRFIFDFEYLPAEEMIIYKQKPSKFSFYTVEKKVEPTSTFLFGSCIFFKNSPLPSHF